MSFFFRDVSLSQDRAPLNDGLKRGRGGGGHKRKRHERDANQKAKGLVFCCAAQSFVPHHGISLAYAPRTTLATRSHGQIRLKVMRAEETYL